MTRLIIALIICLVCITPPTYANDIETLFEEGHQYLLNKDWVKAKKTFKQILVLKSDHKEALSNLGYILIVEKEYEQAQQLYLKLVKVYPNFGDAWLNLGAIYGNKNQWVKAKKAYLKALKLLPESNSILKVLNYIENQLHPSTKIAKVQKPEQQDQFNLPLILDSPFMPTGLSILLPGAGQVYHGVRNDNDEIEIFRGVIYAVVAGIAMGHILYSLDQNEHIEARTLSIIGLGITMIASPVDAFITAQFHQEASP